MNPRLRGTLALLALVLLRVGLDTSRLLSNPGRYWNWEEAYNAAEGWYLWHAGLWDRLLPLQYKAFCGGCTVVAGLAAPILGLGGDHWVLWKGLALAWTAATLLAGFWALRRLAGPTAAWTWAVLDAIPPLGASDGGLMLWGNHQESALFVLLALGFTTRGPAFLGGLSLGVGLWFCRTTAYAFPPLLVLLWAARGRWRDRAAWALGLAAGAALITRPAALGDWGSYRMEPGANVFPEGLHAGWTRLQLLVLPDPLATRMYCTVPDMDVMAGLIVIAAGFAAVVPLRDAGARLGRFVVVAMLVSFAALYASAGFPIPEMRTNGPIVNLRFHLPWFFLLTLTLAVGAGAALRDPGWRRWAAGLALATALGANLGAWARTLPRLSLPVDPWGIPAVSHSRFAWMASWRLDDERLARARSDDVTTIAWLRRMSGYRAAARVRDGSRSWESEVANLSNLSPPLPALEGLAQALTDPTGGWAMLRDENQTLLAHPPDLARALGRGMANNLAFGVTGGAPPLPGTRPPAGDPREVESIRARAEDLVVLARAGLPDDAPCPTCAAVGAAILDGCRSRGEEGGLGACLGAALPTGPDASEICFGMGLACRRPWESPAVCTQAVREAPQGLDAVAFMAGLADPAAGADRPFTLGGGKKGQ